MTKYRGYYIDNVVFRNKAEIDAAIRKALLNKYKYLLQRMHEEKTEEVIMTVNRLACDVAEQLHDDGMTWEEIEEAEIAFYDENTMEMIRESVREWKEVA